MSENPDKMAVKPNRIVSIFKTLRNNWKKTTFGVVLLGFGYNYAVDRYRTRQFMRAYCEEARKYGEQPLPLSVKPRHVTVILNPAAKNGKGKKLYENFSSPLLHLAGLKVSLIQTEQEGQARQLLEIMENTDAVVVAGGDGTIHEAVTGLLRREDQAAACQRLPLGIAPIGKSNSFAKSFYSNLGTSEERLLAESTMAVVRELQEPVDVIEVQGSSGKPVYAVKSIECGAFRDTDVLINKYWYYGALKAKVAYFISTVKGLPGNLLLPLSYALPCQGCSRCYLPDHTKSQEQESHRSRWWHAFIPRTPVKVSDISKGIDYSKVINEECGKFYDSNISCSNFLITILKEPGNKAIRASFEEPLSGRLKFLTDGWSRHSNTSKQSPTILEFKEADIKIETNEDEERWLSIDNERYEKQNIHVTLLPSKVNMFVNRTK